MQVLLIPILIGLIVLLITVRDDQKNSHIKRDHDNHTTL